MQTQLRIVLREVESLNSEQVQILAIASGFVSGGQFGGQAKVSMPKLKTLDSALLAQTLLQCSSDCGGVVTISPEAATALAGVPNREAINPSGTARVLPPYGLSFPCLQELNPATDKLSPETATALANLPGTLDMRSDGFFFRRAVSVRDVEDYCKQTHSMPCPAMRRSCYAVSNRLFSVPN